MLKSRIDRNLQELTSFTQDIVAAGYIPGAEVVRFGLTAAKAVNARIQSEIVVELTRLRTANGIPICLEQTYLPGELYPILAAANKTKSLYTLLLRNGHEIISADERLLVRHPTIEESHLLKVSSYSQLICIERLAYGPNRTPVEHTYNALLPDAYEFKLQFKSQEADRQLAEVQYAAG